MNPIRFDERVALITGAGGGLGRSHALELARRGAKVVVNDPGGSVNGVGGDHAAADQVVAEIRAAGFEAVPNHDNIASAEGARRLVQCALDHYGRIDVLINNAGILRDKSLAKMEPADFESVVAVHLLGSAWCSQAVLSPMQGRAYGRIVMTTSAAGPVRQLRPDQLRRGQAGHRRADELAQARGRQVRHPRQHRRAGGADAHDRRPALQRDAEGSHARACDRRGGLHGQRGLQLHRRDRRRRRRLLRPGTDDGRPGRAPGRRGDHARGRGGTLGADQRHVRRTALRFGLGRADGSLRAE